jgi:ABC-type antimicrobial peptide transport system permease subunit
MTPLRLLLRNLVYHWRGNLAVFLGVVVGAAVLTGALLVGDSLRGSLSDLTMRRLGWVDKALIGSRFFREQGAAGLAARSLSAAILVRGTASVGEDGRPVRQVNVLGVPQGFWAAAGDRLGDSDRSLWDAPADQVVLSKALADEMGAHVGDKVYFRVGKASAIPPETLLGKRDASSVLSVVEATVLLILNADDFGSRFNLAPTTAPPRNAFMPLKALQKALGQEGRVNAIFVGRALYDEPGPRIGTPPPVELAFQNNLTLDDWGLTVWDPKSRTDALFARLDADHDGVLTGPEWQGKVGGEIRPKFANMIAVAYSHPTPDVLTRDDVEQAYRKYEPFLTLESRQLLIEPAVEAAAMAAAKDLGLTPGPTLVYLADTLSDDNGESVPYAVVGALDPAAPPPLGPFLPPGVSALKDDEIVLTEWKGSPITGKPGDTITLKYYPPEQHGEFQTVATKFKLAGTIPMSGPTADPNLTPEFPGVTDKISPRDWKPPFPFDDSRIRSGDANERFWNAYRAAPRAYVALAVGQRLWGSRFGKLTSIRLGPKDGGDLEKSKTDFEAKLLSHLKPDQAGLVFQPVKEQSLNASNGSTDFAGLFLGFSFFLIVAALLLVGLLFRLNLDRRASEFGLLTAVGCRRWTILWLMLSEGGVLAVVGTAVGCLAAVAYAALMVQFLGAFWPGGALQSFLRPHYTAFSFALGGASSLAVSVLTILWAAFSLGRVAPSALLAGRTTAEGEATVRARPKWSLWIALVSVVLAVGLGIAGWFVPAGENQAMTFFGAGSLLLVACLAATAAWMRGARHGLVEGGGWWGVARLGVRNAARHPVRSLLTAGLLASAVFLIVAVEAFRQQAAPGGRDVQGPDGGFALVAESDLPILQDLNSEKGRQEILDRLQIQFQHKYGGRELEKKLNEAEATLRSATVYAFRVRAGDDASCLNLYEPRKPRMLGAPPALIAHDGFQFADADVKTDAERANHWAILNRTDGPLPAFGEQNSVVWVLKKNLGDELPTTGDDGATKAVRIDGLLQDSVFQSGLLLSEENFLKLYPTQEGYQFFLIETPPGKEGEVRELLNAALADRGFEAAPTAERLQSYLAVENTYLSTFQALGGLGLLLGSLGLAVVLLRSVWERRGELALLRALGFRRATLGWLVLAENGFLLLLGLGAGAVSALLAAAPHLARQAGGTPWLGLAGVLAATVAVGLAVAAIAAAGALRAPLVAALRRE